MPAPDAPSKRLMIVDDEPKIRSFIREVAESMGWEVSEAKDGREMMETFHSAAPDLILLDVIMLGVDGLEAIQWLGAQKYSGRVVVMTGYEPTLTNGTARVGKEIGVNVIHTLEKPFSVAKLRKIFEAASR